MDLEVGIVAIIVLNAVLLAPITYIFYKGYKKSLKKPASG